MFRCHKKKKTQNFVFFLHVTSLVLYSVYNWCAIVLLITLKVCMLVKTCLKPCSIKEHMVIYNCIKFYLYWTCLKPFVIG